MFWGEKQKEYSKVYGELVDIPFPNISPAADEDSVKKLSLDYFMKIQDLKPSAVLLQGEFGFTFSLATLLKESNIKVVYATSKRIVNEERINDHIKKEVIFEFERYREY